MAYKPQSSGTVEHVNRALKHIMAKFSQETQLPWTDVLPLAFLRVCCAPRAKIGFSPFEILYRRSPPLSRLGENVKEVGSLKLHKQIQGLRKTIPEVHRWVTDRIPVSLGTELHPYKPGDQVWVKDWKKEPLKSTWKCPNPVILTTPTALKVAGIILWIHHTRVKRTAPPQDKDVWKINQVPREPLRFKIQKRPLHVLENTEPCSGHTRKLASQHMAEACGSHQGRAETD